MSVSDAVHKAVISVDESGTEAAAATAVMIGFSCAMPPEEPPVDFYVDQPFTLLIFCENNLLFTGRIINPN